MNTQPTIDFSIFEALKESVGSDFIDELVQAYFLETPQLISKLQQALAKKDSEAFRTAAHSIKSTSNSFGAVQYGALAKELEMMGREGNLEGASEKVTTLVNGYMSVKQAIDELCHEK